VLNKGVVDEGFAVRTLRRTLEMFTARFEHMQVNDV